MKGGKVVSVHLSTIHGANQLRKMQTTGYSCPEAIATEII